MAWGAILFALNLRQLGPGACLHWDAEACVCTDDRMPTKAELADARIHEYDLVRSIGTDDPRLDTLAFNDPAGPFTHFYLERIRRYYSQISFAVARGVFDTAGKIRSSPTDGIWAFQLVGMALVATGLGLGTAGVVALTPPGPDRRRRLVAAAGALLAVGTSPVFASIARQTLTESIAFPLLIGTIELAVWASRANRLSPAVAGSAASAVAAFFTLRTRYSMGPTLVILTLLALLVAGGTSGRHRRAAIFSAGITFATLVAIDVAVYGPFIFPWVYDQTLVRSTRLFFHEEPPNKEFWIMAYLNLPLLLLPVAAAAAGRSPVTPGRRERWVRLACVASLAVFFAMIALMRRQSVAFQGRHLFALSLGCAATMMISIGRSQMSVRSATGLIALSAALTALNFNSTWLSQVKRGWRVVEPTPAALVDAGRWDWAATPLGYPVLIYSEWADDDRIHDALAVDEVLRAAPRRPLLLVDPRSDPATRVRFLTAHFDLADTAVVGPGFSTDPNSIAIAFAADRPVYGLTQKVGPRFPAGLNHRRVEVPLNLYRLDQLTRAAAEHAP